MALSPPRLLKRLQLRVEQCPARGHKPRVGFYDGMVRARPAICYRARTSAAFLSRRSRCGVRWRSHRFESRVSSDLRGELRESLMQRFAVWLHCCGRISSGSPFCSHVASGALTPPGRDARREQAGMPALRSGDVVQASLPAPVGRPRPTVRALPAVVPLLQARGRLRIPVFPSGDGSATFRFLSWRGRPTAGGHSFRRCRF